MAASAAAVNLQTAEIAQVTALVRRPKSLDHPKAVAIPKDRLLKATSPCGPRPKSSAVSDSVWLQSYLHRAGEASGMRTRCPDLPLAPTPAAAQQLAAGVAQDDLLF